MCSNLPQFVKFFHADIIAHMREYIIHWSFELKKVMIIFPIHFLPFYFLFHFIILLVRLSFFFKLMFTFLAFNSVDI